MTEKGRHWLGFLDDDEATMVAADGDPEAAAVILCLWRLADSTGSTRRHGCRYATRSPTAWRGRTSTSTRCAATFRRGSDDGHRQPQE